MNKPISPAGLDPISPAGLDRKRLKALREAEIIKEQRDAKIELDKRSVTGQLMGDPPPNRAGGIKQRHADEEENHVEE